MSIKSGVSYTFMCPRCDGEGGGHVDCVDGWGRDSEQWEPCRFCSGHGKVSLARIDDDELYDVRDVAHHEEFAERLSANDYVAWAKDVRFDGSVGMVPITAEDIVNGWQVAEWIAPPSSVRSA